VVTHNKRTMSRADVIYGVTMQEFGVSKPVGVRMTNEKVSLEDGQPTVADSVSGKAKSRKKKEEPATPPTPQAAPEDMPVAEGSII
jgi:chromosome segregation protein